MKTVEEAWEYLHSKGIYTIEEFKEAYEKSVLDIGIFTMPLRKQENK